VKTWFQAFAFHKFNLYRLHGGVLARSGIHTVALAAKQHAVPVVVLAGLHELSPLGPGDPEFEMNDLLSPADMIDYTALADCLPASSSMGGGGGGDIGGGGGGVGGGGGGVGVAGAGVGVGGASVEGMEASLNVANPAYDYIPPELVTFFITDAGGQVPAFVKSLLPEIYSLPIDRRFD
jgi:translation initiation factor 2B subunit (eIF-2B alpha/beta/delta family)